MSKWVVYKSYLAKIWETHFNTVKNVLLIVEAGWWIHEGASYFTSLYVLIFYCTECSVKNTINMWQKISHGVLGTRLLNLIKNKWGDLNFRQCFSSVQFSCLVVSDSLRPHESQHARLPVHHQLPEYTQTHIHRVCDAISHLYPRSSPSPTVLSPQK